MSYKNKNILAIVPARGGSKGIKRKNIQKINNISLIGHAAKICSQIEYIDASVISSDDIDMQKEGIRYGLDAPFTRPKELSSDKSNAIEAWRHSIIESEEFYNDTFDITVLLEPTCPLRTTVHVKRAIEKFVSNSYSTLITVSKTDSKQHPLKQLNVMNGKIENYFDEAANIINRQELPDLYHRNGVAYISKRDYLLNNDNLINDNCGALVINEMVVNIDSQEDLEIARYMINRKKNET